MACMLARSRGGPCDSGPASKCYGAGARGRDDGTVNDLRLSVHNVGFQGNSPDCDPILGVPKAETVQCHCLTFLTNVYATSQLERYLNFRYGTTSVAAEFLHRIG